MAIVFPEEVAKLDISNYCERNKVSPEQIERWKQDIHENRPQLLWSRTRHLLFHGRLKITDLDVFEAKY